MSRVDDIIENVDRLPALPQAATRIIEMLTDGHSDLGEIEKLVRLDEAISMTVLRYANSARFGRPGRVFNLKESIVRLGGRLMVQIVLEQQLTTVFTDVGDAALGLERGALWRGAMGGAFAA
ncbi:MAG: HDOD domain-containing protein, partial [Planctomycetota bacterium]